MRQCLRFNSDSSIGDSALLLFNEVPVAIAAEIVFSSTSFNLEVCLQAHYWENIFNILVIIGCFVYCTDLIIKKDAHSV